MATFLREGRKSGDVSVCCVFFRRGFGLARLLSADPARKRHAVRMTHIAMHVYFRCSHFRCSHAQPGTYCSANARMSATEGVNRRCMRESMSDR